MWQYHPTPQCKLYHHGVKGQKWGVKNGPPYPIKRSENSVENIPKNDTILPDIQIYKSVGAKVRNYDVYDSSSDENFHFVEGSKIKDPTVFAGKGGTKKLRPETLNGLVEEFQESIASDWQHCKGTGILDYHGEERKAEVHWFQEKNVGKHKFKVKKWLD